MVYLEHINLVVADIPAMLKFYKTVFPHWKVRDKGDGDWYGKPRKWCHFGDDFQYIALNDNGEGRNRNLKEVRVGLAHFAYVVNNLDAMIKRLNEAGYEVSTDGNENPFRRNVYFIDPGGFEVEFVEYLSDIPTQRNSSV